MRKFIDSVKNAKMFKLLYRGSRDSFESQVFRTLCMDQGETMTICKTMTKDNNERIVGGFTDIPW